MSRSSFLLKHLLFISLALCLTLVSNAQQLQLSVSDKNHTPVSLASVYIDDKLAGFTDKTGLFSGKERMRERFILRIESLGFEPFAKELLRDTLPPVLNIALADGGMMDNIVVTAGRRAENIATVPSSVTILTGKI
ncbi:hypothetical protein [Niabella beijingensis]|uniref:hypothetical protein n=1 Tax=Niabella beijingensis TaxID=2872700 RepID=UPI001CBEDBBC|nr:hypothetical protein [Niabella beijingensis]MBZ4192487.1 hypothetical protein [Niabella beijingensis]